MEVSAEHIVQLVDDYTVVTAPGYTVVVQLSVAMVQTIVVVVAI